MFEFISAVVDIVAVVDRSDGRRCGLVIDGLGLKGAGRKKKGQFVV